MPADIAKLTRDKEIILTHINRNGPSLPVHIAKAANLTILFASAFLSELYSEGKVKMSNMKVGSSSLYYITGQEQQLEKFIDYLNQKEKEAFNLLRSGKILADTEQVPAIRVALRAIKDFAIPLKIKVNEEEKLLWKYFALEESEFNSLILEFSPDKRIKEDNKNNTESIKEEAPLTTPSEEKENKTAKPVKKEVKKEPETDFIKKVKDYLEKKDLEIISIFLEKKKELLGIIRASSLFGKQEYYLIAKDKKRITETELDLALEKSQAEKMPVLIVAPGELDKKASMRILGLRNLIKFINPGV